MATKKTKITISYNAPVTLTFALIAVCLFLFDYFLTKNHFFLRLLCSKGSKASSMPFDMKNIFDYARLFTHIFVHTDLNHLFSNLPLILLLGPILEERYGSGMLAIMMAITSFFTGVLNAILIKTALCGASGIVYMMILLSSFSTTTTRKIPLSFVLVFILYLGKEFLLPAQDNIATFAHIAGGLCGSLFAFMATPVSQKRQTKKENQNQYTNETKKNAKKQDYNDETIVGSIEL